MTHTRTQLVMSLVSGLMLGVAFYHLLPHSIAMQEADNAADIAVWWLMLGLVAMLLLLRLFHFHQHDFSHEEHLPHANDHQHAHHDHMAPASPHVHSLSGIGIGLGLALHTLIDGVALGAVMLGGEALGGWLGIGVFLAILLHKPLDSMSIATVLESGGWSAASRQRVNLLFALMCPLGALAFYFGIGTLGNGSHVVAASLAFSAGAFICIALSDLLPEVHFHSHDRGKLSLAFLLGIAVAYAMIAIEPAGIHSSLH
tara:strand:+ start:27403 stop:28173 length:771 start_codon:yes stop_codon:yes gene_type:complete